MSGFLKLHFRMAGGLFGVRELSVPLPKQPGHVPVFVGTGACPKHSGLYMEGSMYRMHLVHPPCRLKVTRGF